MVSWKTQHVVLLAAAATVASIALTIFVQNKISEAIARKAAEQLESAGLSSKKPDKPDNPFKMMSALKKSDRRSHQEDPPTVRFEEPAAAALKKEKPAGAGTRWTPL